MSGRRLLLVVAACLVLAVGIGSVVVYAPRWNRWHERQKFIGAMAGDGTPGGRLSMRLSQDARHDPAKVFAIGYNACAWVKGHPEMRHLNRPYWDVAEIYARAPDGPPLGTAPYGAHTYANIAVTAWATLCHPHFSFHVDD